MDESRNKEQVYDAEIAPLMGQIIEICKRSGIAMLATFSLQIAEYADLCCTTVLADENGENDKNHLRALRILEGHPAQAMITQENADGSKCVTAVLA